MLFDYPADDGSRYLDWAHGLVSKVVNSKTRRVKIEWDKECVAEGDPLITFEKIGIRKWNPKKSSPGAWRQYLLQ